MDLSGPYFTAYTAFNKNGDINYYSVEKYISFLLANGANKIYLMPYNGRYSQLSFHEIASLNRFVIEKTKEINSDALVIVSDPIHCSTDESIKFANEAREIGADIFSSICREKFYSTKQIYLHYQALEEANISVIAHLMPLLSADDGSTVPWPIDLVDEISQLSHIVAMKEDTKDINYGKILLKRDLDCKLIFAGRKSYFLNFIDIGIDGYLNGISMINPSFSFYFWKLYQEKNINYLNDFVKIIDNPFWDILVKKFGWHRVNKASLEYFNLMERNERLPMISLDNEEYDFLSNFWDNHVKEINKCTKFVLYQQEVSQKD